MDAKKRTPRYQKRADVFLAATRAVCDHPKAGDRKDDEHDDSKRSHHSPYPQYFRMGCRLPLFWRFFP